MRDSIYIKSYHDVDIVYRENISLGYVYLGSSGLFEMKVHELFLERSAVHIRVGSTY